MKKYTVFFIFKITLKTLFLATSCISISELFSIWDDAVCDTVNALLCMEKSRRGTEAVCAAEKTTTHHVLQMSLFELHSSVLHLILGQSFSSSRMSLARYH